MKRSVTSIFPSCLADLVNLIGLVWILDEILFFLVGRQ